jgi:hypothetical protein
MIGFILIFLLRILLKNTVRNDKLTRDASNAHYLLTRLGFKVKSPSCEFTTNMRTVLHMRRNTNQIPI